MVTFPTPDSILRNCAIGSDNDTGGYSTASLDHVEEDGVPCLRFKGELSLHVSPEAKKRGMTHSGWAGWRTTPMTATIFNRYNALFPSIITQPPACFISVFLLMLTVDILHGILLCFDSCRCE